MTYPRVNLLLKSERRYQGLVSNTFIAALVVVIPVLTSLTVGGIRLAQLGGVPTQLESSQIIWEGMEPRLALFAEEKKGLDANRQVLDLFSGWKDSQGSFLKLLGDIRSVVPENVQFTRLSVRTEFKSSAYEKAEDLGLNYKLVIEGSSHGDNAEKEVFKLQKDLLQCEQIGSTFDSIKLASMRKMGGTDGVSTRDFQLVGETKVGDAK